MSDSFKPLVVSAGVPNLTPPGFMALLSPGTVFLLQAIDISSRTFSTRAPFMPFGLKSSHIMWLSVPPTNNKLGYYQYFTNNAIH